MHVLGQVHSRFDAAPERRLIIHVLQGVAEAFLHPVMITFTEELLTFGLSDDEKRPALRILATRRADAGVEDLVDHFRRYGVGFEPPHRAERMHDFKDSGVVTHRY